MPVYLSFKEIWRNRGRFLLFSLVIALITVLVLFIAALASGLATANRQFLQKLDADLLIFQENSDLSSSASRLGVSTLKKVRRVEGVQDVGALGFSTASLTFADGSEPVDVALVGVQPGKPGEPALLAGSPFRSPRGKEAIIDQELARRQGLQVGDSLSVKSVQGTKEEYYRLRIAGITDQRQYFFAPAVIVPIETWDDIRPQAFEPDLNNEVIANIYAVKLADPQQFTPAAERLMAQVDGIQIADKQQAILAIPGYTAQQGTLNTQRLFTLLIGVLVVGGFFQIQTLQKVPQIGMLKAIGSSNWTVGAAALMQIVAVTVIGVAIGGAGTLLLSLGLPSNIPILFSGTAVLSALALLLLIGPLGGMVSIRQALKIEPLRAIGQNS